MTMQPIDQTFLHSLLRADFKSFVVKVFNEVSPNSEYLDNWHIDVICHELINMLEGKQNRIIINIPPRYLKSIICSVAFPAFILGHNPKATIIAVSYSDELASNLALKCKQVIESPWYQEVFPGTKISKNKKSINDFETTKGGGRYATSVNGTLTGRGADFIIIDDPIKPIDALSDLIREKTNDWYGSTLYSRLNNKNEGKILVIMQRLHDEDFTGYLLATDPSFKHIKMPAIAEIDETWIIKDRINNIDKTFTRSKNTPLHPQREDLTKLYQSKKYMGGFNFAGQYQQNPMPKEGGVIKKEWLHFYDKTKLFKSIENGQIKVSCIIQSWDTASKIVQHNDYSVCITVLRDTKNINYLLNVYRDKLEFPDLIRKVAQKYHYEKQQYKHQVSILIEDQASGTSLIQALRQEHKLYPVQIKPEYDKKTRLMAVSHLIENGSCLFPSCKPHWWLDFENELLRFPKSKHDDQCDALSQVLSHKSYSYNSIPYIASRKRRSSINLDGLSSKIDWSAY